MNERIRELAEQAGVIFVPPSIDYFGEKHSGGIFTRDIDVEKFAELIVRECAQVDSEANNVDHVDGETYNQTILQHFGIKNEQPNNLLRHG